MPATVLVDGDPVVYRVGFAGQQTVVHAVVEGPDGVKPYRFEGKGDRNRFLAEHPEHEVLEEETEIEAEPLAFVLNTVKQVLGVLQQKGTPKIYLTGTGNFREKLSTIVPYKVGRRRLTRPIHYQAIRDYLTDTWGARVINGREADDELGIEAAKLRKRGESYIIATIDKDLDQIPGEHYDYARHIGYRVSSADAEKWFWQQALSGDPTDSVPGCWKIGKMRAASLVDGWYLDKLPQKDIWAEVLHQYELSRFKPGCPYADSKAAALETARLVYIQKEPGELWEPPGTPHGKIEGAMDGDD